MVNAVCLHQVLCTLTCFTVIFCMNRDPGSYISLSPLSPFRLPLLQACGEQRVVHSAALLMVPVLAGFQCLPASLASRSSRQHSSAESMPSRW